MIFFGQTAKKRRSQDSPHSPQILFVLFSFGLIKSINNGANGLSVSKLGLLLLSWFIPYQSDFGYCQLLINRQQIIDKYCDFILVYTRNFVFEMNFQY